MKLELIGWHFSTLAVAFYLAARFRLRRLVLMVLDMIPIDATLKPKTRKLQAAFSDLQRLSFTMQENAVSFPNVLKHLSKLEVVSTFSNGPPPISRTLTIRYTRKGFVVTGKVMIRHVEE